jgi:predicted RNA-binding Zn-ribbon protein involved in translation (DUF1610 family)
LRASTYVDYGDVVAKRAALAFAIKIALLRTTLREGSRPKIFASRHFPTRARSARSLHLRTVQKITAEPSAMDPITITCDACGQTAIIHRVRYKYVENARSGGAAIDHVLRETQRDIECPVCGARTQTERHREDGEAYRRGGQ